MPPNMVDTQKDEKAWKRAKARAAKQGHDEDWPYVVAIYQSMTGKKGTKKGNAPAVAKGDPAPKLTAEEAKAVAFSSLDSSLSWRLFNDGGCSPVPIDGSAPKPMTDDQIVESTYNSLVSEMGYSKRGADNVRMLGGVDKLRATIRERMAYLRGLRLAQEGATKGRYAPLIDVLSKATAALEPEYQRPTWGNPYAIVSGIKIHVEQFPGEQRNGSTMASAYGEVIGVLGADGEPWDCYIGQNKSAPAVFVIDQLDENGEVDEHKAMVGFDTAEDAAHAYVMQLPVSRMGGMVAVSAPALASFLANTPNVSAEPFASLLEEAGVPCIRVWAPLSGVGPLASPSVQQANGAV